MREAELEAVKSPPSPLQERTCDDRESQIAISATENNSSRVEPDGFCPNGCKDMSTTSRCSPHWKRSGAWTYKFRKRKLTESTSMVHSPVDINYLHDEQQRVLNRRVSFPSQQELPHPTETNSNCNSNSASDGNRHRQFSRYPKARGVNTMDCTVHKGDALWVPSFWWHEVQSYPEGSSLKDATTATHRNGMAESAAHTGSADDQTVPSFYPLNIAVNFWFAPLYDKEYPCATCRKTKLNQKYADILKDLIALGRLS